MLKKRGFTKWLELHELASKVKSKPNDQLLKNLKAKFQWVATQAEKLGIRPPPELTAFELPSVLKKKKRTTEIIKEVFVKDDIVVDGIHKKLVPPAGVVGSPRLVIDEPEAGIFVYSWSFDLLFQRENEFHLETNPQLIKIQNAINVNSKIAQEMYNKMIYAIQARDDVWIMKGLVDVHQRAMKGLAECKASASNLRRIQVRDIVKEVEDYLKTYSSTGMDIS
ncbi:hypothetical protein Tco_1563208 [Tanacetum coccineum]